MTATAVELARTYLDRLQAKDKAGILAIVTDDFVLEVPFDPEGTNDLSRSWSGEGVSAGYDFAFTEIEDLVYRDVEYTDTGDSTVAFAEGWGDMKMANGRPYKNRYIFRFDTENGKIRRIREYCNPVTGAIAFELPLPEPG